MEDADKGQPLLEELDRCGFDARLNQLGTLDLEITLGYLAGDRPNDIAEVFHLSACTVRRRLRAVSDLFDLKRPADLRQQFAA